MCRLLGCSGPCQLSAIAAQKLRLTSRARKLLRKGAIQAVAKVKVRDANGSAAKALKLTLKPPKKR